MAHTFDTYLQEFLNWLQNEKTCSVNTITAYRKDLEQFGAFLEQEKLSVEDITYRELRFYMASLQRNQELKKTTLSRKTAALKSFFKDRDAPTPPEGTELKGGKISEGSGKLVVIANEDFISNDRCYAADRISSRMLQEH